MATAPQALRDLATRIVDLYNGPGTQDEVLAGIVHGPNDTPGFHWSYNELRAAGATGNYSLGAIRNLNGAKAQPDFASAEDFHFGPTGMVVVTKRLIAAANARDPRVACLWEFCGTTNGSTPHPYTVATRTDDPNNNQGWDSSHVTHVHLSFWRDVCNNWALIKGVADVIAGIPLHPATPKEEDMRIVRNKDHQAVPIVLGMGPKPIHVGATDKLHALDAAGVPEVKIPDADFKALDAWANS